MNFVIFGLTISSAWANGHATPWRALLKGLSGQGHAATFFERDVPYYAAHRDLTAPEFCQLDLYENWSSVVDRAREAVRAADVTIVTSFCADGLAACQLVLDTPGPMHVFYDLDTPVTASALHQDSLAVRDGAHYLKPEFIPDFDLYLSFSGGPKLDDFRERWGARRTAPLYGSVDPDVYTAVEDAPRDFRCALGYLGTYAPDRQASLQRLLVEPAQHRAMDRFLVVGSLYPAELEWPPNVCRMEHLEPPRHPAFFSANRLTVSVSRKAMLDWGYTPSGRLFEATACGTPLLTDRFPGLQDFFEPGAEVLVADTSEDALAAVQLSDAELAHIGQAGRERTLAEHTGAARARQLVAACEAVAC